ncbi:tape measure protein [Parathalassolituus penaei]|uniref:Tape measure protein n=1 Tax=Parathalassolituus penaei TaxID=2997323 RepID=A0A9X3IUG0_9GAMM|nr:tape measure protein [Parathalassolituus penaei]MCY0966128.1 tape measure protein [Parathalassolituus penaei]
MANNLEVALALKIAQTGLENIAAVTRALAAAGVETAAFEDEAKQLAEAMNEVSQQQKLVDQFVDLKTKTNDAKNALEQAQQKTRELALALKDTESPTKKQTAEFERARQATRDAADAYQASRLKLQDLRGTMTDAGLSSSNLAQHQVDLKRTSTELGVAADTLKQKVAATAEQVGASAPEYDRANERQQQLAKAAENTAERLLAAGKNLQAGTQKTISDLAAAGIKTSQLQSEIDQLAAAFDSAGRQQALIAALLKLEQTTEQSRVAMDRAQQQAKELAQTFDLAEAPTQQQARALQQAEQTAIQAASAFERNQDAVSKLKSRLSAAGVDTNNLADRQLELASASRDLDNQQQSLIQRLKAESLALDNSAQSAEQAERSHKKISEGVESISTQLSRLQNLAGVAWATDLIGNNLQAITDLVDGYTNMTSRMKLAVGETGNFDAALASVRDTANNTGSSLESVGDLFSNLTRATKELSLSQSEVAELTDTISKSMIVSGASAQEADAAITQLGQALQSGVLRGDEFNSIMEQSPRLARAMAESLGVNTGELRNMAEEGKLTADVVVKALQQQSDAIRDEFEQMPTTIGQATQRLTNEWQTFLGELNNATGASELVVSALNGISGSLDDIAAKVATTGASIATVVGIKAVASMDLLALASKAAAASVGLIIKAFPFAAFAFAIDQVTTLVSTLKEHQQAAEALAAVNKKLDESQKALAARFAEISEKTGVTVTNMKELDAAITDGRIAIDEATGSYISAAQALELLAERTAQAKQEAVDAAKQMAYSQEQLSEAYQAVNQNLQTSIDDNSKLAGVLSGEVLTALKGGEKGVASLAIALRNAEQQGSLTADQINDGLGAALQNLSDEERTRFGELLKATMAKVAAGAEDASVTVGQLQKLLESLKASELDAALTRLGVSQAELNNQISKGTAQAINDLGLYQEQLKQSGADATTAGRLTETAFINAYQNAKSAADKAALDEVMARWEAQGLITADAVKKITAETSGLGAASDDLARRMKDAGIVTQASLDGIAESARKLYDDIVKAGLPIAEQQQAFMNYAEAAIAANSDISESELRLQAARLGMTEQLDELINKQKQAGDTGKEAGDKAADGARKAKDATQDLADSTEKTARDVQGLTDDLGAWFWGVRSEMQALSAEAGAMFDSKLGINSGPILTEVEAIEAGMQNAREQLAGIAKDNLQVFDVTGINRWKNSVLQAKGETILAYGQQKLKFEEYMTALQSGETVNQSLINSARNATANMNLLGSESLATLRNAISSATAQLQQMSSSATDTLTSLRQELYSLRGETEALQESQYKQRKAELEAALAEAQAAGNKEAIAAYKEALSTLAEIRKEQKAQAKADGNGNSSATAAAASSSSSDSSSSTASTTSKTTASSAATVSVVEVVRIEMGSLSANVIATDKSDILAIIEDAMRRSV